MKVAAVKNDTALAEAGGVFAGELRAELSGRGRLAAESSAAPELSAELVSLKSNPTVAGGDGAAAFRLDGQLRVRAGAFDELVSAGEDYLAGVDVLGTEANRRAALRRLARTLAREAVERWDVAERLR